MAKLGYLRVSTEEQRPDRQIDALSDLCDELHIETISATAKKRPVYTAVMQKLQQGDTFVIWEISRAYRNVADAIREAEKLRQRNIILQIGHMHFDLSIPEMEFTYIIMAASAQLEVRRLAIRTVEGMKSARNRGKHVGRISNEVLFAAHTAIKDGNENLTDIAEKLGCSEAVLKRGFDRLKLR